MTGNAGRPSGRPAILPPWGLLMTPIDAAYASAMVIGWAIAFRLFPRPRRGRGSSPGSRLADLAVLAGVVGAGIVVALTLSHALDASGGLGLPGTWR